MKFTCLCSVLCNDAKLTNQTDSWKIIGDPTEGASSCGCHKAHIDVDAARRDYPRVAEIPFTSERKMMSTVHKTEQGQYLLATKGAVEIRHRKNAANSNTSTHSLELDEATRQEALRVNDNFASEGFRVLAVGYKLLDELPA